MRSYADMLRQTAARPSRVPPLTGVPSVLHAAGSLVGRHNPLRFAHAARHHGKLI
jgi:hypothetical protein